MPVRASPRRASPLPGSCSAAQARHGTPQPPRRALQRRQDADIAGSRGRWCPRRRRQRRVVSAQKLCRSTSRASARTRPRGETPHGRTCRTHRSHRSHRTHRTHRTHQTCPRVWPSSPARTPAAGWRTGGCARGERPCPVCRTKHVQRQDAFVPSGVVRCTREASGAGGGLGWSGLRGRAGARPDPLWCSQPPSLHPPAQGAGTLPTPTLPQPAGLSGHTALAGPHELVEEHHGIAFERALIEQRCDEVEGLARSRRSAEFHPAGGCP